MSDLCPEAKSVGNGLYRGRHVTLAFVLGFAALQLGLGWHPHPPPGKAPAAAVPFESRP